MSAYHAHVAKATQVSQRTNCPQTNMRECVLSRTQPPRFCTAVLGWEQTGLGSLDPTLRESEPACEATQPNASKHYLPTERQLTAYTLQNGLVASLSLLRLRMGRAVYPNHRATGDRDDKLRSEGSDRLFMPEADNGRDWLRRCSSVGRVLLNMGDAMLHGAARPVQASISQGRRDASVHVRTASTAAVGGTTRYLTRRMRLSDCQGSAEVVIAHASSAWCCVAAAALTTIRFGAIGSRRHACSRHVRACTTCGHLRPKLPRYPGDDNA